MEAYLVREAEREVENLEVRLSLMQRIAACPNMVKDDPNMIRSLAFTINHLQGELFKAQARLPHAPEVHTVFIIPKSSQSQPVSRRIPRWAGKAF